MTFNAIIILINIILKSLALILPLLIAVAYLTLLERKVMGAMHQRRGPNVVGIFGMLQPFADGLKLFVKETVLPSSANTLIFIFAPILTFLISLATWAVIPFGSNLVFVDINVGALYILGISSLGVYGIITSGWSSNSKWSFLGALRSAAQMISYEVSIGIIILCVLICSGSFNLSDIVHSQRNVWYIIPLFPLFVMFFISGLAETNRAPFDLPEAEAELVSGYSTEYSAIGFVLFFLGEYTNMILMSGAISIYFLGGWQPLSTHFILFLIPESIWFALKITIILFLFIWVRAAFPRYRYDQLMRLGWKIFLPFSLGWLLFISGLLVGLDLLV
uniref:NADH dehydrogenase subunit 1 n=1 Tax=Cryptomonas gyropyrenoidosa TaxID=233257 RepID=UPI0027A4074A|nr:NADH dehydrogenase subunit 1 [Cryptomonas gyropyrenoidosa]WFQ82710.1 NADH dehydrogenase subunit 1 [Cryptomonas gyropyrenoidosa]